MQNIFTQYVAGDIDNNLYTIKVLNNIIFKYHLHTF